MVEERERVVEAGAQRPQLAAPDAAAPLGAHLHEADVVRVGRQHGELEPQTNLILMKIESR